MTNFNEHIEQLLRELGFDSADEHAKRLLSSLIKDHDVTSIDENFKVSLRQQIAHEAAAQKQRHLSYEVTRQDLQSHRASPNSIINLVTTMKKFIMPAILAVFVFVAGGAWYGSQGNPNLFQNQAVNQILSDQVSVEQLGENSFGDLSQVEIVEKANSKNADTANLAAGSESSKMAAPGYGTGGGGDVAIMPPYPDAYRYQYVGGSLPEIKEEQSVFKRQKPIQTETVVSKIIRIFSFGLIDLTKFRDTKLQNVAFLEDREFGYGINVDLNYGNVSLYQNWEKWPQPSYECYGYNCGPKPPLTKDSMPSDSEIVAATERFISDYGISLSGYGKPRVVDNSNWVILYEKSEDKANFIFPEMVSVIYPLVVDGKEVYDESGNLTGMNFTYDIRNKKVSSMYDLISKRFESSDYKSETNQKRLIEIAERGGFRNYPYYEGAQNVMELQLDTPTVEMVRIWYSKDPLKPGEELYVPALVFPIVNAPDYYWQKNIAVPLVKSILDSEEKNYPPIPMPMPIEDGPAIVPVESSTEVGVQYRDE